MPEEIQVHLAQSTALEITHHAQITEKDKPYVRNSNCQVGKHWVTQQPRARRELWNIPGFIDVYCVGAAVVLLSWFPKFQVAPS